MVIFLPKQMKAASFLTLKNYNLAMNKLENTRVILKLPKFTINQKYDLQSLLNMPTAFSTSANFSDLTDDTSLYINRALHQSYLKIDEDGLEAAAATAISMNATSCAPQDEPVIYFTADHPFAFAIVDTNNKTILFMGTFDGK
jgi:serpin B